MYQRFVCFKFKENTPPDAIRQHLSMFAALEAAIPQIASYVGGETFPGGEGAGEYDTTHYVAYHTQGDIDTLFPPPRPPGIHPG